VHAIPAVAICAALSSPAFAQTEVRLSPVTVEGQPQPETPPPRYYPAHAQQQRIEGDVTLRCQIRPQGRFGDCEVLQETPTGEDFGLRALEIAGLFHLDVPGADGQPLTGGVAVIPLRFRMAPATAASGGSR
jgi:TonB family protein